MMNMRNLTQEAVCGAVATHHIGLKVSAVMCRIVYEHNSADDSVSFVIASEPPIATPSDDTKEIRPSLA